MDAAVCGRQGSGSLPAGATLSIRKLSIGATALTVQPVIGAPGQALSEYQPQPADLMPV